MLVVIKFGGLVPNNVFNTWQYGTVQYCHMYMHTEKLFAKFSGHMVHVCLMYMYYNVANIIWCMCSPLSHYFSHTIDSSMYLSPLFLSLSLSLLTATTMFIAILVTCHVFQPIGFMLAIIIAFLGFFLPMGRHRIPHEAGWQNPVMLGGLIMGVSNTVICYFFAIWPHILMYIVHVHLPML